MAEFPMLPLWTDAYLADTTHLTTLEHGAYNLLLITMWRAPGQQLPDDDKLLARYTKLTMAQWRRMRPTLAPFFVWESGILFSPRMRDEADAVRRKRKSQSDNARAKARKNKESTPAMAVPSQRHGCAPISISISKEEIAAAAAETVTDSAPAAAADLDEGELIAEGAQAFAPAIDPLCPPWRQLVQAFDHARIEAFGDHLARPWPHPDDKGLAAKFLEAGADLETCQTVFAAVMQRQAAAGAQPPARLSYMAQPIADALAAHARPLPQGHAGSAPRPRFDVDDYLEKRATA